jgi:hypothetical protein
MRSGTERRLRILIRRRVGRRWNAAGFAALTGGDRGSFTIEASLVAPLLVFATLAIVALVLYTSQLTELHRNASARAERAAYDWNMPDTAGGAEQGLYWRIGEGAASWFGMLSGGGDRSVKLPLSADEVGKGSGEGADAKLARAAAQLPAAIGGSVSLRDRLLLRRLQVVLQRRFRLQSLSPLGLMPTAEQTHAEAAIVDPVELIRLVDLTRSYTGAIRGRITPGKALALLQQPQPEDGGAVSIRSEREASAYIRKVTGGSQRTYPLAAGKSRVVDALDANGIAHQAFYTYTEPQLLGDQLPKDFSLLQDGTVKGVIWHFFIPPGGAAPSAGLRGELERKGIVVVVHQ